MQSGYAAVEMALKEIGRGEMSVNKDLVANILQEIKEITKRGTPLILRKNCQKLQYAPTLTN
jgi:2-isopropylmalate synthase